MRVCPQCNRLYGPKQERCTEDGAATEDHVKVLLGKSLGPYQVDKVIGEGGMGVVYLGEHPTIARKVALKVLRPELSLRDSLVERFIREARAVNTIGHDNIVNIYDFGKTPFGSFYIVMEHLEGQDLRTLLEVEGPQPLNRARTVLRCIGAALAAAHAKGFIHRDVKPENIMLTRLLGKEHAKLLDFGIVKLLTDQSAFETLTGGAPLGTPQYMSPEQFEQGDIDNRADIFSMAAVIYELITGELAYPGKGPVEVRKMQKERTPTAPSLLREDIYISRRLDAALLWALSPQPDNRCSRMVDLITAFEEGYQESQAGPPPDLQSFDDKTDITAAHYPARSGRSRLLLGVGLLVLACAIGAALFLLLTGSDGVGPARPPSSDPRKAAADMAHVAAADATPEQPARPADPAALARELVSDALKATEASRRVAAIKLIGAVGVPLMVPQLEAALTDPDPGVRRAAALALGAAGASEVIPALRKALASSVGYAAVDVAQALAQLGDRTGRQRLTRELKQARDDFRRKYALHALGRVKDPAARGWWKLLRGQRLINPTLRITALGYLAAAGESRARKELEEAARTGDWSARIQASAALWPANQALARKVLTEATASAPPKIQAKAAAELARFGVLDAGKTLLEFLDNSRVKLGPAQRSACIVALGRIPGDDAIKQALAGVLTDPDDGVALAAAVAHMGLMRRQE